MKPIKLCMQAFGPFAKYHEVDFRSVNNAPLFGFYGATGSGKTSVLDAICFALFGKSSGGEREAETLRSDYATVEEDSFVSLIFSVGEKFYFIHRIPEYEKKKQKGTGTTWQKHEAFLFEIAGTNLDKVSLKESPGTLIAEKKITHVLENIINILGYNAQQFRQVVMLPQGKFREFLTANSKARSEILRQLFNVSLFEKLEHSLKQKSKSLNEQLNAISHQKEAVLQATGLESLVLLQEEKSQKEGQQAQIDVKMKAAEETWKSALKNLETARKVEEMFVHYDQAITTQEALEKEQGGINAEEKKLALSKKAASLMVLAQKKNQAKKEAQKSQDDFSRLLAESTVIMKCYNEVQDVYLSSEKQQSVRDLYDAEIRQAKQHMETLKAQEVLSLELKSLQTDKNNAKKKFEKLTEVVKRSEEQQKASTVLQQELIADRFQVQSLRSECSILSMQMDQFLALERKRGEAKQSLDFLAEAQKNLTQAEVQFERSDNAFKLIEALYFAARAAHFAQELEEGKPCPVCGGLEHPSVAHVGEGDRIVSDAIFKKAQQERQRDEKKLYDCANNVKSCEEKKEALTQGQSTLETQLAELLEKNVSLLDLKRQFEEKTHSLQEIEKEIGIKAKQIERGKEAKKKHVDSLASLEEVKEELQAFSEAYIRKETQCTTLLAGVPSEMRQQNFLKQFLVEKIQQRDKAQAQHQAARDDVQLYAQKLTSVKDQKKATEIALTQRKEALETALKLFNQNLVIQGFSSEQDFEVALMDEDSLDILEHKITKYYQEKKVVEAKVDHYSALIKQQQKPVLEVCEKQVSVTETAHQALQHERADILSRLSILKRTEQKYLAKMTEFDVLDQKCRRAQTLSDVANGQGDNQRKIRLVDWLLSSYFDDVLAQANLRFTKMTNFQFRLQRGLQKSKGRGVSGLDIEVYDEWSCSSRPAVSLSGGESFLAALALALGLSDVVQQESGGIVLETIFIDEGFGHLDEESLDQALNILTELSGHNRSVGIISHVEEVKRRVPAGFTLVSSPQGSSIEARA